MRRTRIVCTLGPASRSLETITAMIEAGMDVARLNTSHGTLETHAATVRTVREAAKAAGRPVAVLLDLAGPKIRSGQNAGGAPLSLVPGQEVRVEPGDGPNRPGTITVAYDRLAEDVRPGEPILFDDGALEIRTIAVENGGLRCTVVVGGQLTDDRGVAFPHSELTLPALTERDRAAIAIGVEAGVDFFALSFVRDAEHVAEARQAIAEHGADTPIVAKIERRKALERLDEIVAESDGVMVARGDLGVELPPEEVPLRQREIIAAAGRHLVPVITATQMLESMIHARRPTRAEASDVANAVWDNTDAVMLSGETAVGDYPVETVAMMDRIVRTAEQDNTTLPPLPETRPADDHPYMIAAAASRIARADSNIRAIACFTRSGYTATLLSKVRPAVPIVALSPSEEVCRRLMLNRGVFPLPAAVVTDTDSMLQAVDTAMAESGIVSPGDEILVVVSLPVQADFTTNAIKFHHVGESESYPVSNDPTPIARTQDEAEALMWVDLLLEDGINAATYRQGISGAFGGGIFLHQDNVVIVPRSAFDRARELILDAGGHAGLLSPPRDGDLSQSTGRIFLIGGLVVASLLAAIAWRSLL